MKINWSDSPNKTEYGAGMVVADIELDKDSTLTVYCHKDDTDKVEPALRKMLDV